MKMYLMTLAILIASQNASADLTSVRRPNVVNRMVLECPSNTIMQGVIRGVANCIPVDCGQGNVFVGISANGTINCKSEITLDTPPGPQGPQGDPGTPGAQGNPGNPGAGHYQWMAGNVANQYDNRNWTGYEMGVYATGACSGGQTALYGYVDGEEVTKFVNANETGSPISSVTFLVPKDSGYTVKMQCWMGGGWSTGIIQSIREYRYN